MKLLRYILFSFLVFFMFSCGKSDDKDTIEVVAKDFSFEVKSEIPSGWDTFEFKNQGHAEHFFLLNSLPDSISYPTYHKNVVRPFVMVMDSLNAGMSKGDAINLLVSNLAPWYFTEVKQMGGPGIIEPGMSEKVTLNLPPGRYVMECYIKEDGVFHSELGMIKPITVTEKNSGTVPPNANYEITLTNFKYTTSGEIKPGHNVVAVHFKEHPEAGLGNDVQLIKLTDETNMQEVIDWLDWMNIGGLESPAPVEFLGGMQEMPVGNTAYFEVDLKPGNYAWIAEASAAKGMVEKFTVE